jgi:site-specific DNA-methyltransferase (adenine-specific)
VLTDPPYASGARRDAERQVRGAMLRSMEDADWFSHDAMTTWGLSWFLRSAASAWRQILAPGGHVYIFSDWRQTPTIYGMLEACGYRVNHCLVWAKPHYGMGTYWRNQHEHIIFASLGTAKSMRNRGMGSILTAASVPPTVRLHPTEKPVALLQRILYAIAADSILDPFMGVGSTGIAAVHAGRSFVGIEIEPYYFDIACRRIEEAYKQPDFFLPQPVSSEQLCLVG